MSASVFSVLQEEMSYMPSRSAEVRKALKKLREIDALKEKTDYTQEELEKLAKETYWKNILDPPDTKAQLDAERKAKQNKRHLEKESKKEAKRLVEEELLKKQQKRDSEEREKHKRLHEEYLKRKAEREAAEENSRREYEENRKAELEKNERDNRFKQQYIDEFAKAVAIYKSPGRAFRKLSLKYHPDKNPENREEAENIQKILGDIRSTYM
jgi:hypothetical protein